MSPNFKKPPKTFILEASKPGAGGSWTFVGPEQVILAMTPEEVSPALEAINKAMARGLTLAGYVSYEAAFVLEPKLAHLIPEQRQLPLIWLIAYGSAQALSRSDVEVCFDNRKPITLGTLTHSLPRATYLKRIEDILEYIRAGDIYQANFTFQYQATLSGSPKDLYAALRHTQPVPYGGFIEGEDWAILSSSPELFFEIRENRITSRPMKGTALRQPASATDAQEVDQLKRDPKQRSENLMILDLIRNDLSRICVPGSVKVPSRFDIESYRTLHQMTSTVEGTLSPKIRLEDILKAIFPCGSITGAPKIRAMEILSELETAPRGIYTGALGMIAPDGSAQFNVAIRTAYLEQCRDTEWQLEVGVGGGIVHDSTPEGEWAECQTKLKFLDLAEQGEKAGDFDLIETLRWSNEQGFDLFARHLDRLKATADYFSYPLDIDQVKLELKRCVEGSPSEPQMVRLLVAGNGALSVERTPLPTIDAIAWHYVLSEDPISKANPYLYHKTTRREIYESAFTAAFEASGCDEILFVNEDGVLTEGARTNFFIEKSGMLFTSPIEAGLLDGTLRRELIETGRATERSLTLDDLSDADACYFGNSVRGLVRAYPCTSIASAAGE